MDLRLRRNLAVPALSIAMLAWGLSAAWAADPPLSVEIDIAGPDAGQLRPLFVRLSELEQTKAQGTASLGTAKRLADGDARHFIEALHSEGFYAGDAKAQVGTDDGGIKVKFTVTPGARYHITQYEIRYVDEGLASRPTSPAQLDIETNGSPVGSEIVALQQKILGRLRARGYPLAQISERRAEIIEDSSNARMVFITKSGVLASFGETVWPKGLRTRTDYLEGFVPWQVGQRFNLDRVSALRDALVDTGLFTVIDIEPGTPDADGKTPVLVSLTERKPRTFAFGLSYSTNLGIGGQTSWIHRNLRNRGESLEADLNIAEAQQSGKLTFKNPRVMRKTDLVVQTTLKNENTDAFDAATAISTVQLQYKFQRHLTGSAGVELFFSKSTDTFGRHSSALFGLPIGLTYSDVNSALNPTKGISVSLSAAPYVGSSSGAVSFSQFEGTLSYHVPFDESGAYVGALWTRVGASIGPGVAAIPPDKRYYAGGAGSVRGYGYRLLGPTDTNGDPIGGRSVLEGGGELRFPVRGNFGGVVFLEAGGVSKSGIFVFDSGIRYAAGLGVRYYTAIGPIRADIAFPLDPRSGIDDPVQFYISLGQAF